MKKYLPLLKPALLLTPGVFLLTFWMLTLSSSEILVQLGAYTLTSIALILSFAVSYSITIFVHVMLSKNA